VALEHGVIDNKNCRHSSFSSLGWTATAFIALIIASSGRM
jgi:hypothetical protein